MSPDSFAASSRLLGNRAYPSVLNRGRWSASVAIEASSAVVTDEVSGFPARGAQDKPFVKDIVQAMQAYASGALALRASSAAPRLHHRIGFEKVMVAVVFVGGAANHAGFWHHVAMKSRFEGAGRPLLVEAVMQQEMAHGRRDIAEALIAAGTLEEYSSAERLTQEGSAENDVYLLVAGVVAIVIKGHEVNRRRAGQHVGEMAAIEPAQPRSGSIVALETVVTLKICGPDFNEVAEAYPAIWRPLARELARRLFQRNELIAPPNESPKAFIISSKEALPVAKCIRKGLEPDVFSRVWNEGVFFAGGYTLEALEKSVAESDFAIAVAQPDDIVTSRRTRSPTLRDNVLFELGLFMGRLTRHRAILVHPRVKGLKLPSDLQGLTLLSYQPRVPRPRQSDLEPVCAQIRELVQRLGVYKTLST